MEKKFGNRWSSVWRIGFQFSRTRRRWKKKKPELFCGLIFVEKRMCRYLDKVAFFSLDHWPFHAKPFLLSNYERYFDTVFSCFFKQHNESFSLFFFFLYSSTASISVRPICYNYYRCACIGHDFRRAIRL